MFDKLKEHSADSLGSGTSIEKVEGLEKIFNIQIPGQFRQFLLEIGYAELFGEEIYSIYEIPDEIACLGLHWMNRKSDLVEQGYLEIFNSDIDGIFYLKLEDGTIFQNSMSNKFANSFVEFSHKIIDG